MQSDSTFVRKCISFLGSNTFFVIVLVVFFVEAAWIALVARYPQAFDEQFHLGIIQLYAHQWSPFFAHQPVDSDQFGALTQDPSYLYHYLMSFPWRLITLVTHNFEAQVITMRLLNVVMLGSGLFVFRKLLRLTSASRALVHTTLMLLVLTPVVPLLGSQINYDNALIPLTGLAVLWCVRLVQHIKSAHELPLGLTTRLLILMLLTSLVKYAFLPVFAAIVLIVAVVIWRECHTCRLLPLSVLRQTMQKASRGWLVLGTVILAGAFVLFVATYGVNVVRYHTPIPDCSQVLSQQQCMAYAPWQRNYTFMQSKVSLSAWQLTTYPFKWVYQSMSELIFTIGSSFNAGGTVDYYVGTQSIAVETLAWTVFGAGVLFSLFCWKWIWRNEVLRIFLIVTALYILALLVQNYRDFLRTGQPVAIHGRYLLPILPLLYGILALSFHKVLQAGLHAPGSAAVRKIILTAVVFVILITQGGGAVTYIVRSDPSWFWPDNSSAKTVNKRAKKILKPVVIGR